MISERFKVVSPRPGLLDKMSKDLKIMLCSRSSLLSHRSSRLWRMLQPYRELKIENNLSQRPFMVFVQWRDSSKIHKSWQIFQENYIGRSSTILVWKRQKQHKMRVVPIHNLLWEGSQIREPPSCTHRLFFMKREGRLRGKNQEPRWRSREPRRGIP